MSAATMTPAMAGADLLAEMRSLLARANAETIDDLAGLADELGAALKKVRGRISRMRKAEAERSAPEPKPAAKQSSGAAQTTTAAATAPPGSTVPTETGSLAAADRRPPARRQTPAPAARRRSIWRRAAVVTAVAVVVLVVLLLAGCGAATGGVPAPAGAPAPAGGAGPGRACVDALDAADESHQIASQGFEAASAGLFAAADMDLAGMDAATARMNELQPDLADVMSRYVAARDECIGGQA